jgi:hypothetical protein
MSRLANFSTAVQIADRFPEFYPFDEDAESSLYEQRHHPTFDQKIWSYICGKLHNGLKYDYKNQKTKRMGSG